MTKTNETTLKILNWFFEHKIFAWRQNTGGMYDPVKRIYRASNKVGITDIIAILPPHGQFLGIEVKTGKDKLRLEQAGFIKNIFSMGGEVLVVKNLDDFFNQVRVIIPI